MNYRSLAFRLAAWYAVLIGATFALVGAGTLYGLEQYLRANARDALQRRSTQVEQILAQAPLGASGAVIGQAIEIRVSPEFNNRFVRVTRLPSQLIYQSGPPADRSFDPKAVPVMIDPRHVEKPSRRTEVVENQRLMLSLLPIDTQSGRYLIEFGASIEPIGALHQRLLIVFAILLPTLAVCAVGGGYLLVNHTLRPVDRMAQTAEQMSMQNLEAQLPVLPTGDALQRLSLSLNHLLARLRDSVQISRRFLADASHELRTPLTVIKGELQEIVRGSAVGAAVPDRVGSVLEEVARLEHLVASLLALSRLDVGDAQREWVAVDLSGLAASTCEQMRLMAEDRGIQMDTSALHPMVVYGDRSRLKQVIVNLLDNAIRFTPRGGAVTLRIREDELYCALEVRDTGMGIAPAALPHVFDRFFRTDEARARVDGGAGLGLAIAKSICSAHGAQIQVESEVGRGSSFRVCFPHLRMARGRGTPFTSAEPIQTRSRDFTPSL